MNSPLTLITGKNGSGKSTFINSLKHVYNIQNENNEFGILSLLDDYKIEIKNQDSRIITVENKDLIRNEFKLPTIKDFSFDLNNYILYKYSSGKEMEDYREEILPYDIIPMDGNRLSIMRGIIDKQIVSAEKIIDEENPVRVYYRMKLSDGTEYDSYTMGSGEYYINQFLWEISNIKIGEIVLIEELENYLHPDAQKKIIEELQNVITTRGIQVLMTTHSPTIIDHVNNRSRILIKYYNDNVVSVNDCPNWLAKDCLGETINDSTTILLEDKIATVLFDTIISFKNKELLKHLIYHDCNGFGNIQNYVEFIKKLNTQKIIGVVDGDVNIDENNYLIKLPSDFPPEIMVISYVKHHYDLISDDIKKPIEDIKDAFEHAIIADDYHTWLPKISLLLGENALFLWIIFVKIWCIHNMSDVGNFYEKFYDRFNFVNR